LKFQVSFKTPDAVGDTLDEIQENLKFDDYEKEDLEEFTRKWIEYGEYVTVEFDSVKGTCRVVEQ
jgi:hypothetical protein